MKFDKDYLENNGDDYPPVEINYLSLEELEQALTIKNLNPQIFLADIVSMVYSIKNFLPG